MRTAQRIDFVGNTARKFANVGGSGSTLIVDFRVFSRGPAHVAGLIYTTNFWASRAEQLAVFQRFEGDFEVWKAEVRTSVENASFEYVIFCDDHRDVQTVSKIYNTNNGETFRIRADNF